MVIFHSYVSLPEGTMISLGKNGDFPWDFRPGLEAHGELLALAVGPGSWLGAQKQLVGEWMVPYDIL